MQIIDPARQFVPGLNQLELHTIGYAKELDGIGEEPAFDIPVRDAADHNYAINAPELCRFIVISQPRSRYLDGYQHGFVKLTVVKLSRQRPIGTQLPICKKQLVSGPIENK